MLENNFLTILVKEKKSIFQFSEVRLGIFVFFRKFKKATQCVIKCCAPFWALPDGYWALSAGRWTLNAPRYAPDPGGLEDRCCALDAERWALRARA